MSDNKTINTMIELTKTNRITLGVVAVLVILLLGFLFMKPAKFAFNTTLNKELSDLNKKEYQMSPQDLAKAQMKKDASIVVVDIRSPYEFAKKHLPEAQNFYSVNLFEDANISFFKNLKTSNKTAVIYGNTVAEANVPFMILKQMGIENIKLMSAGFEELNSTKWSEIANNPTQFDEEKPVADFAQNINNAKQSTAAPATTPTVEAKPATTAKPVVKPVKASGGDEGC